MEMVEVESSTLEAVGYDAKTRELHVRFRESGATYVYDDVPESCFSALMIAESIGRYFNDHVRDTYYYRKL